MRNSETTNYLYSRNTVFQRANNKRAGIPDPAERQKPESQQIIQRFFENLIIILKRQKKPTNQMIRDLRAQGYTIHKQTIYSYRKGIIRNASLVYLLIYANYVGYSLQDLLFTDLSEQKQ
jgi:hypothetical protein